MRGRIAMISEHASPLAATGSVDAGGQSIYVAHTAREAAQIGYEVDIFTRRDEPAVPTLVRGHPNVRVVHVDAGPARFVRKEELLPHMTTFAERVLAIARRADAQGAGYQLVHAHYFMSGLVARRLKDELAIPYVVMFHALGRVRLLHQSTDVFPVERGILEEMVMDDADAIVAECPQDAQDLCEHYACDAERLTIIPCGFDPAEFKVVAARATRCRLLSPGNNRRSDEWTQGSRGRWCW